MPGASSTDTCLRLRHVPGLGKPGATLRQHRLLPDVTTIFFATSRATTDDRPLFLSRAALLTSQNPCTRGSSATTSTPATPTRHRPRHSSHGYLDYDLTTLRSRLLRQRHKGLPPAWEPRWLPLQPQTPRCVDRYDCGGDVRRLRLQILLQSHRLRRYVVTMGDVEYMDY